MSDARKLDLPTDRRALGELRVGERVLLSGPVFTARDATHRRLAEELAAAGELPYGLVGQVLFYAGPTPAVPGRPAGSIGPTTASRMDSFTPALLQAGIVATIGKGARSPEVRDACRTTGSVYFAAVGGAAALLGSHVSSAQTVAYAELGPEALVRVDLSEMPVYVAIDAAGRDLYAQAADEWRATGGVREA